MTAPLASITVPPRLAVVNWAGDGTHNRNEATNIDLRFNIDPPLMFPARQELLNETCAEIDSTQVERLYMNVKSCGIVRFGEHSLKYKKSCLTKSGRVD
jgi:hypothetical protein